MSRELKGRIQKENGENGQNRLLWIKHAQREVYFSPVEGFEKKEFHSQDELMDYARACISSGYHIG